MEVIEKGQWVWVSHDVFAWLPCQVEQVDGDDLVVISPDGETYDIKRTPDLVVVHSSSLKPMENMVDLLQLSEASILHDLRLRYYEDHIYTFISSIVVSINPYKVLPCYGPLVMEQFKTSLKQGKESPPHVYSLADRAWQQLREEATNQAIVISGESGAGKTECTKLVLQYMAELSGGNNSNIERKILQANPILEAYGNAQTVRNHNSSRFGKWIEIMFNSKQRIIGSRALSYLLEKSRLVRQAPKERNFHIFYQLCAGFSIAERAKYGIQDARRYRILGNMHAEADIEHRAKKDSHMYKVLRDALDALNFTSSQQDDLFKVTCSILHIGNLAFVDDTGAKKATIANLDVLEKICELLSVERAALESALVSKKLTVRTDVVTQFLTTNQANDGRDAFNKSLYERLFKWLLAYINKTLRSKTSVTSHYHFVGVLDIFGFEVFETNYFEQFMINFANEKLQQHFTRCVFKLDQTCYADEGIDVPHVEFVDNQDVLDIIEQSHAGILSLISEQLRLRQPSHDPKDDDETLLSALHKQHGNSSLYQMPKTKSPFFSIRHYAGEVTYAIDGFIEKSKDTLNQDLALVLLESTSPFVAQLFSGAMTKTGAQNPPIGTSSLQRTQSLGGRFRSQLTSLMNTLNACQPHFIRCIKPNEKKLADHFDSHMVLRQLRYLGLVEVVNVRRHGYPVRRTHEEFMQRYGVLAPAASSCQELLSALTQEADLADWQCGSSQVFMKPNWKHALEKQRELVLLSGAIKIQAVMRGILVRRQVKAVRAAMTRLQDILEQPEWEDLDQIRALVETIDEADVLHTPTKQVVSVLRRSREYRHKMLKSRQAKRGLVSTMELRDEAMLSSAIESAISLRKAQSILHVWPELDQAVELRDRLRTYLESVRLGIEERDTAVLIATEAQAMELGLQETALLREVRALLVRLGEEETMKARLMEAIKQRQLSLLRGTLLDAVQMALAPELLVEAQTMEARLQLEGELTEALRTAIDLKNVGVLSQAIARAEQACIAGEEAVLLLKQAKEAIQRVQKEITQKEAKKVLKTAIKSRHRGRLEAALEQAKSVDIGHEALVMSALQMLAELEMETDALIQLRKAFASRSLKQLSVAVKTAEQRSLQSSSEYKDAQSMMADIIDAETKLQEASEQLDAAKMDDQLAAAAKMGLNSPAVRRARHARNSLFVHNNIAKRLKIAIEAENEVLLESALAYAQAEDAQIADAEEFNMLVRQALDKLMILQAEQQLHEREMMALSEGEEEEQGLVLVEDEEDDNDFGTGPQATGKHVSHSSYSLQGIDARPRPSRLQQHTDQRAEGLKHGKYGSESSSGSSHRSNGDSVPQSEEPWDNPTYPPRLSRPSSLRQDSTGPREPSLKRVAFADQARGPETLSEVSEESNSPLLLRNSSGSDVSANSSTNERSQSSRRSYKNQDSAHHSRKSSSAVLAYLRTNSPLRISYSPNISPAHSPGHSPPQSPGYFGRLSHSPSQSMGEPPSHVLGQPRLSPRPSPIQSQNLQDRAKVDTPVHTPHTSQDSLKLVLDEDQEGVQESEEQKRLQTTVSVSDQAALQGQDDDDFMAGYREAFKKIKGFPLCIYRSPEQWCELFRNQTKVAKLRRHFKLKPYRGLKYQFHKYARLRSPKDFSHGKKHLLNKKKLKSSMLKHTWDLIPRSLMKLSTKAASKKAVELFKTLQGFMGDRPLSYPDALAADLLQQGLLHFELRDEIFAQIMKQISDNTQPSSLYRGWQSLSLACETFPPSSRFCPFVYNFLYTQLHDSLQHLRGGDAIHNYIVYCAHVLPRTVKASPPAECAPSIEDVRLFRSRPMNSAVITICFPDGSNYSTEVQPSLRTGDLLQEIFDLIELTPEARAGFCLFYTRPARDPSVVDEHRCILDFQELDDRGRPIGRFTFAQRCDWDSTDPKALTIMYHQLYTGVCQDLYPLPRLDLVQISLLHQRLKGRIKPVGPKIDVLSMGAIHDMLPTIPGNCPPPIAPPEVLGAAPPDPAVLLKLLRTRVEWFGSRFFIVQNANYPKNDLDASTLILAINHVGVFMLCPRTKTVLRLTKWKRLKSWKSNLACLEIRIAIGKGRVMFYPLFTNQGQEVAQEIEFRTRRLLAAQR